MSNDLTVDYLAKLVSLPSVNPEHTDRVEEANEFRVANFLSEELAAQGFTIAWDRMTLERGTVLASYGPPDPVHTVLFEAHTDTVGVADMKIPPFDPVIRDGRLYGRGACDTKGPMAAALAAFDRPLLDALAGCGVRVVFAGVFGEEAGNVGAERLVEQGMTADTVVVLEPTELKIVHAHKGALWYAVELTGQAAHGSDPEKGVNAIFAMARFIQWLQEQTRIDAVGCRHPDVGVPTLNIGRIRGGVATNIVAHRCEVEVDRRMVPGEDSDALLARTRDYLEACKANGWIRDFAVRPIKIGMPYWTAPDADGVRRMQRSLSACGCPPALASAAWYSDAGAFSRVCRDVLVFGPGSIRQAHTVDEFIDVEQLQAGTRVLRTFLELYLGEAGTDGKEAHR